MHRLLEELVSRLPSDSPERVNRAKTQYNQLIRKRLMHETRLNLQAKRTADLGESDIPIKIVAGFPALLRQLAETSDEDIAAELIGIWESDVDQLDTSSQNILALLQRLQIEAPSSPVVDQKFLDALELVGDLSNLLKKEIARANLAKRMFAIQEDILGVYRPNNRYNTSGEIELYWGALGVAAELLQVSIQDLAVVVLIHELAHGYTHLGKDIDDLAWDTTQMFDKVDRGVVEGLAQYYTDVISEYIGDTDNPGVHDAYLRLRRRQSGWYRVHDEWVKKYSPEVVRISLIKFRRDKGASFDKFQASLANERDSLKANDRPVHWRVKEQQLLDSMMTQVNSGQLQFLPAEQAVQSFAQSWDLQSEIPLASLISEWRMAPTSEFEKSLDKLDRKTKCQVLDALLEICRAPITPRGDTVKPLSRNLAGYWRFRIGDNRLLYRPDIASKQITVVDFRPRNSIYED